MQSYLIENSDDETVKAIRAREQGKTSEKEAQKEAEKIVPSYQHPCFTRDYKLACKFNIHFLSMSHDEALKRS